MEGGGKVQLELYIHHNFFFAYSFQNENNIKKEILTVKTIHSYLPRTVKKRILDTRALAGVLIRHFLIALYSSFFIL